MDRKGGTTTTTTTISIYKVQWDIIRTITIIRMIDTMEMVPAQIITTKVTGQPTMSNPTMTRTENNLEVEVIIESITGETTEVSTEQTTEVITEETTDVDSSEVDISEETTKVVEEDRKSIERKKFNNLKRR